MNCEFDVMTEEMLTKVAMCLQKHYRIDEQEALEIIYEEWELIEHALNAEKKIHEICNQIVKELNELYRVA